MSDKRIIDLEAKQTLGSGDYLAADSAQGTYKVDANTNIMTPLTYVRNNVANSSASPDKYSSSTAYKVGDMVIQNDILYKCTTACSAASWAVNSACFTATTLASVVTQLNSDLKWKLIGSKTGQSLIDISNSDYNEFLVIISMGTDANYFQFTIPKIFLTSSEKVFRHGYGSGTSNMAIVMLGARLTSLYIVGVAQFNNTTRTDLTSNSTITVYGR